jgi:hypothetical protein
VWVLHAFTFSGSAPANRRWWARRYDTGALVADEVDNDITVTLAASSAPIIRIGAANDPNGGYWDEFDGQIALVSVYNRVLITSELEKLFRDPFGPLRQSSRPITAGYKKGYHAVKGTI